MVRPTLVRLFSVLTAATVLVLVAALSCNSGDSGSDAATDVGLDSGLDGSVVPDAGPDGGVIPDGGPDGSVIPDGGPDGSVVPDGGPDGGVKPDGGIVPDGGPDGGVIPDGGPDGSVVPDGGIVPDAGPDGGISDGGSYPCSPNCPAAEMVEVPAGLFHMGCNEDVDFDCYSEESPYHDVTLSGYSIDKYETKVSDYKSCVTHGGCTAALTSSGCNYSASGKGDDPINCVEWAQAKAYCQWVGKRLPTEAEWEKAARGTDGRKFPWGSTPEVSCSYAVMSDSEAGGDGCGSGGTMAVGSKTAGGSTYGAMDMIGNVWEWVNDWYDASYYASSPSTDPAGPGSGSYRVLRGGSWYDDSVSYLRTSTRNSDIPTKAFDNFGFRCVR